MVRLERSCLNIYVMKLLIQIFKTMLNCFVTMKSFYEVIHVSWWHERSKIFQICTYDPLQTRLFLQKLRSE